MLDAKCRNCRARGEKLFLKGERCYSPKCAMTRRPYKPGVHRNQRSRGLSEFGRQLTEKQKIKLTYGIEEKQLRRYFEESKKHKGSTGEMIFKKLELRLDNVVFRMGLANSRSAARQLTSHGHYTVNNRRSRIPSRELKIGDVVSIRKESREDVVFKSVLENIKKLQFPSFVSVNPEKIEGKIIAEPSMADLKPSFDPGLVVEYYSK